MIYKLSPAEIVVATVPVQESVAKSAEVARGRGRPRKEASVNDYEANAGSLEQEQYNVLEPGEGDKGGRALKPLPFDLFSIGALKKVDPEDRISASLLAFAAATQSRSQEDGGTSRNQRSGDGESPRKKQRTDS